MNSTNLPSTQHEADRKILQHPEPEITSEEKRSSCRMWQKPSITVYEQIQITEGKEPFNVVEYTAKYGTSIGPS